jgi:hypothetical protein
MDESMLWMESLNVDNDFRRVRMVNSIYLNFDTLHSTATATALTATNKRVEKSEQERHASWGSTDLEHRCCRGRLTLVYA